VAKRSGPRFYRISPDAPASAPRAPAPAAIAVTAVGRCWRDGLQGPLAELTALRTPELSRISAKQSCLSPACRPIVEATCASSGRSRGVPKLDRKSKSWREYRQEGQGQETDKSRWPQPPTTDDAGDEEGDVGFRPALNLQSL